MFPHAHVVCLCLVCILSVLNATFSMTFRLLRLGEDERGILQNRSHDCLVPTRF